MFKITWHVTVHVSIDKPLNNISLMEEPDWKNI